MASTKGCITKAHGAVCVGLYHGRLPAQIFTVEPTEAVRQHTRERVLGIPDGYLSAGEDASFTSSLDGLRVSARLYLPAAELNHPAPYPVVFYIHGGPKAKNTRFRMVFHAVIQQLTLRGIAVFVPNAR
ncbi:MAG: hypothetical protein IPL28_09045 [Chloroflexi bacterium]|nr:hypothetical protein [Chloroflexota bacterium]